MFSGACRGDAVWKLRAPHAAVVRPLLTARALSCMPEISRFFGIVIRMHFLRQRRPGHLTSGIHRSQMSTGYAEYAPTYAWPRVLVPWCSSRSRRSA